MSAKASAHTQRPPKAKVAYRMYKDKGLRDLLRNCGLPVTGDRETMVRRHEEYILVYNAQCDARVPMTGVCRV